MTTVPPQLVLSPVGPWPPAWQIRQPVALYRHLDQHGLLLYVGITADPSRRWLQHAETSVWARYAATTYVQWFPGREAALAAERRAIADEEPIFNTARPGRRQRAHTDRQVLYLQTAGRALVEQTFRRVPCRAVNWRGLCISCGPDADRWLDSLPVGGAA